MKTYNKRLFRSKDNKIIAGVLGGIGEYFDVDPVMIRVVYILLTVFTGVFPGFIAYICMMLVVPKESDMIHKKSSQPK